MNYYYSEIFLVKKKAHLEFHAEFRNFAFYSRPHAKYNNNNNNTTIKQMFSYTNYATVLQHDTHCSSFGD